VPIAYEGCLIGSLAFNSIQTTKTWSSEDIILLRALADIFASALMRKRSEEAWRESEERFRQLAENVDAVLWVSSLDEHKPLYISPAYKKIWGRSVQGYYEGDFQDWLNTVYPDDRAQVRVFTERQNRGERVEQVYRIIKPDGSIRWIRDRAFPVHDTQGRFYRVAGVAEDITDRKLAEDALLESQAKLNAILDSAIAVILRFRVFANRDWNYEFFSSAAQMLYGYTPEELIADKNLWVSRVLPEDLENVILPKYEDIFAERTAQLEYRFRHKDGRLRWFSMTMLSQRDEATNSWVITSVNTDISDAKAAAALRKQAEERLEASLQEKEALLKEVHHRVKNNLQVVSSLLDLQSQRIQEPQILEMFRESQNRVRSMALIHEKLYQSESLSKVNLADYIESLVMYLIQTYAINPDRITLHLNLEPVALNLDSAIPCGLILNELVSNALKHAFPGDRGGTLWINLRCLRFDIPHEASDAFELVVGNDGVKLPEFPNFCSTKSLGFQLVNVLIQQLHGQMEVSQSQGTEFKLRCLDP
jgi:PAS domain S-box-containing protein